MDTEQLAQTIVGGPRLEREPYWLRRCHGFRVDWADGRVGIVEDVLYGADREQPAALAVRVGLFGRRVDLVDVDEVEALAPRARRVVLRAANPS